MPEMSLILKNKMTALGISLKIIYLFLLIIKRPMRDAFLCMGEATPPDPHFLFAIALQP